MGPPAAFQAEDRGVRLSLPAPSYGSVVQSGRTLVSKTKCRWFKSILGRQFYQNMSTKLHSQALYIVQGIKSMTRTIINQVRELLDRNLDAHQIAQSLHIHFDVVRQAIQIIQKC